MPPPTLITSFPVGDPGGQTVYVHVRDITNGFDLYELNPDVQFDFIASLTKLMTALLVMEYQGTNLSGTVTFTAADVGQPDPALTVDLTGHLENDVCTWLDVLYGMMLPSGCDSCQVAARLIGDQIYADAGSTGSSGVARFVERMNDRATELGCTQTVFTNSYGGSKTGSTQRNRASARDVSRWCEAMYAYPALQTVIQSPTHNITVTGGNARSIPVVMYNRFINGPTLSQAGISDTNTKGGKNGTWITDGLNHFNISHVWRSPNGTNVVVTTMNANSLLESMTDQRGMMWMLPRDFPYLVSGAPTVYDDSYPSVKVLIGFDGADLDESTVGRAVSNTSVGLAGSPLVATGFAGTFNSVNDFVSVADAADVRIGSGDATIEMWFAGNGTAPGAAEWLFVSKLGVTANKEYAVNVFNNIMQFFLSSDGANWNVSSGTIYNFSTISSEAGVFFNGAPRHLAFVKQGSVWAGYINGERQANTQSLASIFDGGNPMAVGFPGGGASFLGSADEYRYTAGVARYTLGMYTLEPQKFGRAVSPPPPPPLGPGVSYDRAAYTRAAPRLGRFVPPGDGLLFRGAYRADPPAAQDVAAGAAREAYPVPFNPGPRRDGPFARLPRLVEHRSYDLEVVPPDPPQVYPPRVPAITLGSRLSPFPFAPVFVPPVSPDSGPYLDPNVPPPPPPPPPPGAGTFGPARNRVPLVPRAPEAEDQRVRPHIDKVAYIFNALLRLGYIRAVGDDFEIVGGGVDLPRAPAATDDASVGAVVGQTFVNRLDNSVYVCVNNSVGSAVWVRVG